MNKRFKSFLVVAALAATTVAQVQYVNPMIGTDGMGHTFPGACVPFGIVQLSPDTDTIPHNVNGTYQKPNIDLFEMAKQQNNQPARFCDTEAGKNIPAIKVNISEEGLRALHGSKMKGSVDIQKQTEELKYISEHQPVESFTNRLSRVMQNSFVQFIEDNSDKKLTIEKKGEILLEEFRGICDEITSGYEEGNRVRFISDDSTEDGYRKLSKEDELSILLSEFSDFVELRFGKEHQERSIKEANALNDMQKIKQQLGYGDVKYYEPEYIPDGFVESLIKNANQYVYNQK